MSKGYFAPSVRRAFEILKLVSKSKDGAGISDIARDLGMAKSTVHGMTSALEEIGAVLRDPVTKKYALGFTLFELGKKAYSQVDLKDLARPVAEELMERTHASVFLGVLNWDHVTILDVVEPRTELKITAPIGTTLPLLAGAAGKVFLSRMDEEEVRRIIKTTGLTRFTENSITSTERYLQEIRTARENGFATDDEEYIPGVRAVAAPIKKHAPLLSAIWVVGLKASLDEERVKVLTKHTVDAARAIDLRIEQQIVGPMG
jgi:DNA-binding IclR family transcriptional regulator